MNLLQRIVTTGCSNVKAASLQEVEDTQRAIRIVNTLCLICAVMSFAFSICCHYLLENQIFVWPAFLEAIAFISIICLNGFGKNTLASILMILVNNVTIQYYSAVMGRVTEVHLLFIFLIGLSLILFHQPSLRRLTIGITIGCFLAGEINMYNGYFPPLLHMEDSYPTQYIIRWITIPSILVLDMMVISFYVKNVDRLRHREMEHVQEMLETVRTHNTDLEQLTAKLASATDAKTVFVRETSHEIRTPLNAIFGISQLLQLKVSQDRSLAPIRLLADHLYAASFNTREIINNVLEFSRIEAGKPDVPPQMVPLNIAEWVNNIVNIHQYVASVKMVRIRYKIADDMPEVIMGDKIVLTKMLNNLLSNAIKFTASESRVTIHIFTEEDKWFITVTDQGDGISEDRLATIFDAFVSERNIFLEGTGLGLHITRHLAATMGGKIEVKSEEMMGTSFTVSLPMEIVQVTVDDEIVEPERMVHLNAATILIIEDDKMSQMVLSRFLTGLGSRVMLAGDGMEGMLLGRAAKPDIIILDAHIPGMSGKDTLAHIRGDEILKNVPVIIASGDAFNEASEEMMMAGANEYLVKPIEFKALHATLTKYIE